MFLRKFSAFLGLVWLGLLLPAGAAVGDRSVSQVEHYFQNLTSLRATFVQRVFDADSRLLEVSSGHMVMQRPGRFRWDYQEPYEQIIVADGERLWLYDSDLEQVTVRYLDTALGATPLALLSGAAPIEEVFTVSNRVTHAGLQWYELHPKDPQAEFKTLRVAFQGVDLSAIELEDAFNQRTQLNFEQVERNVDIDPKLLRFVPPPGVDVVGDLP